MNEKWFTRGPQSHVDESYMRNMKDATQFFMRWYKFPVMSFRNMLKHMHRLVAVDGYQGYTNSNYILKVCDGFRGERDTTWYPVLKKQWFSDVPAELIIRPAVPYMPESMSHWLKTVDEGYELHLPDSKYVSLHLLLMEILIQKIRANRPLDLESLVAYIQLFVIGHPFEKINFSICMAQVNAILWIKGFEPVYHGWLDFECFMYDYSRLAEIFRAKILRNNIN